MHTRVMSSLLLVVAATASCTAATIRVAGFDSTAIAAAIQKSQPGDEVLLPAGTYAITEAIVPKTRTKLSGAGQAETIIRCVADRPIFMLSINGCEDVEVCHLTLEGDNNKNASGGIAAGDSRRLNIHHVTVRNLVESGFGPHGIRFSGIDPDRTKGVLDSVIADCTLENIGVDKAFGCGIRLSWGSSRNQVLRCRVHNTGRGGIFGDNGSTDLIIRGNTVTGSHGEMLGIEVWGGCDRCVIEDNSIDHWLSIGGCDWCAVRRNVISAKDDTFGFIGIEAIGSHLIFTDNVVDDGQLIGLSVSSTCTKQYHYYANNTFRRCTQWAAQLQGESTGIQCYYFYRCKFVETTVGRGKVWYPGDEGHGFRINGNTQDLVLEECEISGNGRHAIQVTVKDVDGWSFQRCLIRNNAGSAYVGPPALDAAEWVDCVVEGNGSDALPDAQAFPTPPPTATIQGPTQLEVGETVRFVSTSKPGRGTLRRAMWDLGDGIPQVGDEVTHVYLTPGTYVVTLIIWDEAGRAARAAKQLHVLAPQAGRATP